MSLFEDVMAKAVQLPLDQREHLAQALGLKLAPRASLPMFNNTAADASKTNPQAWKAAERGHAVLALEETTQIEPGPSAIRGIWSLGEMEEINLHPTTETISQLPKNAPVVVHTSAILNLAFDLPSTREFWNHPPVEIRIATASYLKLLEMCTTEAEKARLQAFVQPYAVLSLGPMASSRAAQLMLETPSDQGLKALDALIAATAIAHEIPLVTREPEPFAGIEGLQVVTLA